MRNPLSHPGELRMAESPVHFSSPVASPRLAGKLRATASASPVSEAPPPPAGPAHAAAAAAADALSTAKIADLIAVRIEEDADDVVRVRSTDTVGVAAAAIWKRYVPTKPPGIEEETPEGAPSSPVLPQTGPAPSLAAVVMDDDGRAIGVLDAADILELLVEADPRLFSVDPDDDDSARDALWEQLTQTPVSEVVTPQRMAARARLSPESSLLDAAVRLRKADRLPIVPAGGSELWGVADAASVMSYLRSRAGDAAEQLLSLTLKEAGMGHQGALCVDAKTSVAETVSLMGVTRPPLSGIAVTDGDGRIVGHFSLPHVVKLAGEGSLLTRELAEAAACGEREILCCPPETTVSQALDALLCSQSPALYVLEGGKAVGAVSLSEFLQLLVRDCAAAPWADASDDD
eukprot:TRINITY_DN39711_c0_g1_i1.p1 TRINITY_DN39711_c0_g1~~TRINITY_DN39711_c0_g1_i1.p1  ORF type:complete len:422 (+),score=170.71 TRINITY_DN39711_c0_g1_i1:55-1266(+)